MKPINLILTGAILFTVLCFDMKVAHGQVLHPRAIQATKSHIIKSNFTDKTYKLYVSLPKKYSVQDTVHYPVLYVLDGKFSYNSMSSIRDVLDLGKEIKDIIIVAIDDSSVTEDDWFANRYNDFTPSVILQSDTLWSRIMNIPEGKLKSGGAESFLHTLQREMIPFIEKQYKTTADRGLSGHSLGALFAGYCLLKNPGLFKRYGINSPSFWWNNNEMLRYENYYANLHTELPVKIFFSVGGLEDAMMLTPFNAFTNSLKSHNYKGLSMTIKIFDGETHLSVVPASSSRTLKALYGSTIK